MKKEEQKPSNAHPTAQEHGLKKRSKKRRVSKTWEAALRLKGSLIVNDPKFLL